MTPLAGKPLARNLSVISFVLSDLIPWGSSCSLSLSITLTAWVLTSHPSSLCARVAVFAGLVLHWGRDR